MLLLAKSNSTSSIQFYQCFCSYKLSKIVLIPQQLSWEPSSVKAVLIYSTGEE